MDGKAVFVPGRDAAFWGLLALFFPGRSRSLTAAERRHGLICRHELTIWHPPSVPAAERFEALAALCNFRALGKVFLPNGSRRGGDSSRDAD